MDTTYLVRYGLAHHVGRFASESGDLERGRAVVVRTPRGLELGRVMARPRAAGAPLPDFARVVRVAGPDDLERARQAERERPRRLEECERVFREGVWPILLVDVEVLPDLDAPEPGRGRVLVHYLGPHQLDTAGLRLALRNDHGLDVGFEPVGRDAPDAESEPESAGCGACGEGGDCGSTSGGCGTGHGGACAGCTVKDLVARRRSPVPA